MDETFLAFPRRFLIVVGLLAAHGPVPADAQDRPRILFDTDFRADCDDVGALAVLHALADADECSILGVVTSTTGPRVVAAIDAVNTYYGRPDLPIGLCPEPHTEHFDPYAPTLGDPEHYPSDQANAEAPDGVALYRRLLFDAPDRSVTVVVVGYATCADLLLETGPDHRGDGIPLSGRELVQRKVVELVQMAGVGLRDSDTFNLGHDAEAAVGVNGHWPTPITYSPLGGDIKAGSALSDPESNPVAKAFELYPGAGPSGVIGDRQCWDEIAVLYAVRGTNWRGEELWRPSPWGDLQLSIRRIEAPRNPEKDTAVDNVFAERPGGRRRFLIRVQDRRTIAALIEELMTRPPRHPRIDAP